MIPYVYVYCPEFCLSADWTRNFDGIHEVHRVVRNLHDRIRNDLNTSYPLRSIDNSYDPFSASGMNLVRNFKGRYRSREILLSLFTLNSLMLNVLIVNNENSFRIFLKLIAIHQHLHQHGLSVINIKYIFSSLISVTSISFFICHVPMNLVMKCLLNFDNFVTIIVDI